MGPANRDPVCCKFPVQIWVPSKGLDLEGELCKKNWGQRIIDTFIRTSMFAKWPQAISVACWHDLCSNMFKSELFEPQVC